MSQQIIYFSNYSGNTKKFVEKLDSKAIRIPILWDPDNPILAEETYVLMVPTYGGGSDTAAIPRQVRMFLNIPQNRSLIVGVVGFGNTNFGSDFCKAARLISSKAGVPLIAKVEIFGTQDDLEKVKNRLEILYGK